jgi:hypothetical protein
VDTLRDGCHHLGGFHSGRMRQYTLSAALVPRISTHLVPPAWAAFSDRNTWLSRAARLKSCTAHMMLEKCQDHEGLHYLRSAHATYV